MELFVNLKNIILFLFIISLDKTKGVFGKSYPLIFKSQHTDSGEVIIRVALDIFFLFFLFFQDLSIQKIFSLKKKKGLFSLAGLSFQIKSTEFFLS